MPTYLVLVITLIFSQTVLPASLKTKTKYKSEITHVNEKIDHKTHQGTTRNKKVRKFGLNLRLICGIDSFEDDYYGCEEVTEINVRPYPKKAAVMDNYNLKRRLTQPTSSKRIHTSTPRYIDVPINMRAPEHHRIHSPATTRGSTWNTPVVEMIFITPNSLEEPPSHSYSWMMSHTSKEINTKTPPRQIRDPEPSVTIKSASQLPLVSNMPWSYTAPTYRFSYTVPSTTSGIIWNITPHPILLSNEYTSTITSTTTTTADPIFTSTKPRDTATTAATPPYQIHNILKTWQPSELTPECFEKTISFANHKATTEGSTSTLSTGIIWVGNTSPTSQQL